MFASMFASMPEPPYVAVIFSSVRTSDANDPDDGYGQMADQMELLAAQQPGYIGIEATRSDDGFGITVSYWSTEETARDWKQVVDHLGAQRLGREQWYQRYIVRIAVVQRQYDWQRPQT
ncbi:MAG: hypothetical protein JWN99_2887 [Ilumatobacteraceae bacterium]|nr:hypothetical protein [Ilumatobacteraceae bacterium]